MPTCPRCGKHVPQEDWETDTCPKAPWNDDNQE